ncbi:histidine phosphatase family protein [Enterovibrio calviensis]|uniref:histidine phosphatase family protein n=1 Tax=Enterovibrio calviensis TaxID=91359 RepID=UPI0004808E3B|nr:histidine phosphatase family protein [Enterovibrio calviensis]
MTVFNNTYLAMRHGQSQANVANIVVSDPAIGCEQYGLSPTGEQQAKTAAQQYQGMPITQIFTSDFKRTKETAAIVADTLNMSEPQQDTRLRERYFGEWEGKTSDAYEQVWTIDALTAYNNENGVESTAQVRARALALIHELDAKYQGEVILLVAHGDTLQILATAFNDLPPNKHRTLPHHETGELKVLVEQGEPTPF